MTPDLFTCPATATVPRRLWVYTNYDCNLSCSYCVAESHPRAERRGLAYPVFERLLREAAEAGVSEFFLTGGEPFILPDICERIALAASLAPTTVLTNAMLLKGTRLERLLSLRGLPLTLQVSLDSALPEVHDAYRGNGAWEATTGRIRELKALGFRVAIGATETPASAPHVDGLRHFVAALGIAEEDFFIRPLARRGFSAEGLELSAADLIPELTVANDGVYWHPLTATADLLLTRRLSPLSEAFELLHQQLHAVLETGGRPRPFK